MCLCYDVYSFVWIKLEHGCKIVVMWDGICTITKNVNKELWLSGQHGNITHSRVSGASKTNNNWIFLLLLKISVMDTVLHFVTGNSFWSSQK